MKFALLITAAPFSQQGAQTALRFARAAIAGGHCIERVFFFRDGVHNASQLAVVPQDESNIPAEWQALCQNEKIDAVVCVSAALKRGIADTREQQRHSLSACNIAPGMVIAGLGQLVDMLTTADRVITFG